MVGPEGAWSGPFVLTIETSLADVLKAPHLEHLSFVVLDETSVRQGEALLEFRKAFNTRADTIVNFKVPVTFTCTEGTSEWAQEPMGAVGELEGSLLYRNLPALKTRELADSCAALKNRQSYSAVSIGVGTPPQHFDLVADTGSSAVIVTHCACQEASCYGYSSSCFTGTNRSETFPTNRGDPHLLAMEFGSGVIYGVLATDVVSLGPVKARMNESLVLMYDHQLDSGITDFEGIFGLGLPYGEASAQSWLRQAAVQSFSMCFSNFEEDGVLRLLRGAKHEPMEEALQMRNVGKYHWALNFHGISLGNATTPVLFCGGASSCGLIPDSGTTLILGPPDHLLELFASLCDRWPRCAAAAERAANASSAQSIGISDWIKHAFERWGLPPIRSPFAPSPATERKMETRATAVSFDR
eukprot:g8940.t1